MAASVKMVREVQLVAEEVNEVLSQVKVVAEVKLVADVQLVAEEVYEVLSQVKVVKVVVEVLGNLKGGTEVVVAADSPSLLLRTPQRASSIDPVRNKSRSNTRSWCRRRYNRR